MRVISSMLVSTALSALMLGTLGLAVAPAASAATLTVGTSGSPIDCRSLSGSSSQTLTTELTTGDAVTFTYIFCNGFTLTWSAADFTTTFGTAGSLGESGNNLESRSFTSYQGSAASGATLITLAKGSDVFTITQGTTAWTAKTAPDGQIGTTYNSGAGYQFNAPGGSGDYSVATGSLPPGLAMSVGGLLSGTPTTPGSYTFSVARVGEATTTGDLTVAITSPVIDKVTICHRTRATTNPYVLITVSVNSVIGSGGSNGHDDHNTTRTNSTNPTTNGIAPGSGPFDTSFSYPSNRKWWGDIIPPFTYSGGTYAGLNWGPDWSSPNPVGGSSNTWLEDSEFADAVLAGSSSTTYYKAAEKCLDLANRRQSPESAAIDDPQKYFNVSIANGEDPESIFDDLSEQSALTSGGSPVTVPTQATMETTYASTAAVETDPASGTGTYSATLNGTLKSGTTWTTWTYEWGTSPSDVATGSGVSHTYTPGTDSSTSIGAGATTPTYLVTGLSCNTTYYFRIIGSDGTTTDEGSILNFTTSACSGAGGGSSGGGGNGNGNGNGGGNSGRTPTTPTTPAPLIGGRPGLGSGRPAQLEIPIARPPSKTPGSPSNSSSNGNSSNENTSGGSSSTAGSTTSGSPTPQSSAAAPDRPRSFNPIAAVPAPAGTSWIPQAIRIKDPVTGEPVLSVSTPAGTWTVDPETGTIDYRPNANFAGTATVDVVLSARSGEIAIQPMRTAVQSTSRILVLAGGVPKDINGGITRWR